MKTLLLLFLFPLVLMSQVPEITLNITDTVNPDLSYPYYALYTGRIGTSEWSMDLYVYYLDKKLPMKEEIDWAISFPIKEGSLLFEGYPSYIATGQWKKKTGEVLIIFEPNTNIVFYTPDTIINFVYLTSKAR